MNYALPATPLRAVVFDLDGLMVNTEDLFETCGDELLSSRGHAMTDEVRAQMIGRPALEALQILIDHFQLKETAQELALESDCIMRRLLSTQVSPMPGLLLLLEKLASQQIPTGVATSSSRVYAAGILDRIGIAENFSFVLAAEDVTRGKPHPEIYQMAAQRLAVEPSAMMVLEDSSNGCRAAVAAGAYAVAVPNRHTCAHRFDGVHLKADSLADPRLLQVLALK